MSTYEQLKAENETLKFDLQESRTSRRQIQVIKDIYFDEIQTLKTDNETLNSTLNELLTGDSKTIYTENQKLKNHTDKLSELINSVAYDWECHINCQCCNNNIAIIIGLKEALAQDDG